MDESRADGFFILVNPSDRYICMYIYLQVTSFKNGEEVALLVAIYIEKNLLQLHVKSRLTSKLEPII